MLMHTPFSQTPGISRHSSISRNRAARHEWQHRTWPLGRDDREGKPLDVQRKSKTREEKMRTHVCGRVHVCTCVWVYVGVLRLMEGEGNINEWQTEITKPLSRHWCVYLDLVSSFFMLFQNIHFLCPAGSHLCTPWTLGRGEGKSDCWEETASLPEVCGNVRLERERGAGKEQRRSPWSKPTLAFQIQLQCPLLFHQVFGQVWGYSGPQLMVKME